MHAELLLTCKSCSLGGKGFASDNQIIRNEIRGSYVAMVIPSVAVESPPPGFCIPCVADLNLKPALCSSGWETAVNLQLCVLLCFDVVVISKVIQIFQACHLLLRRCRSVSVRQSISPATTQHSLSRQQKLCLEQLRKDLPYKQCCASSLGE